MPNLVRDTFAPLKHWLGLSTLLSAADDDKIIASTDMKVGAYTIAAQPSIPSLIGFKVTAGDTADTMGTLDVVGTDCYDLVQTETVIPVAGSTVYTAHYYKTITSITGVGWVIDGAEGTADTIIAGVLASGGFEGAKGLPVTVEIMSGNVWINDRAVAVADATAIKKVAGQTMDFVPTTNFISMISDASGATVQVYVWDL